MVKTVELTGTELAVSDLGGQNAAIKNLGSAAIYASIRPNVAAGADDVVEIPAGGGEVVLDANGTVYLLGTGKAQCTGTPYATPNFKMPSSSASSGGGGGKSQGVICGTAEYASGGIKSIPVEVSGSIEESFAAALAAETGWELQPDGVSVLNDGAGFRFVYRTNGDFNFVCLVNDMHNGDSDYLDNFQYLENRGDSYYMDVCCSPTGAVAFGFRLEDESPKLTFIMTKDGNGDAVCMATYYQNSLYLEWAKKEDTEIRKLDERMRSYSAEGSVIGLFEVADGYSGGVLSDCYCVYWVGDFLPEPGSAVSIDGKRFAIVYNHIYPSSSQFWIAMPVAEGGGV